MLSWKSTLSTCLYIIAVWTNIRISRILLFLYPHSAFDELPALLNQKDASLEKDGTDYQDVDAVVWGIIYLRFWVRECASVGDKLTCEKAWVYVTRWFELHWQKGFCQQHHLYKWQPRYRLGICQKICMTQFSGERILHTENAEIETIFTSNKQRECIIISNLALFWL